MESQQWSADYRTAVGQRRELTLADGSQITLNTDTAIDVLFDANQRLINLREGEILVQTATDVSPQARPFFVSTRQGRMQALGTRFTVRELQTRTHLAVLDDAVRVELTDSSRAAPLIVNVGQRTDFSSQSFGQFKPVGRNVSSHQALESISLSVPMGSRTVIVGPSTASSACATSSELTKHSIAAKAIANTSHALIYFLPHLRPIHTFVGHHPNARQTCDAFAESLVSFKTGCL